MCCFQYLECISSAKLIFSASIFNEFRSYKYGRETTKPSLGIHVLGYLKEKKIMNLLTITSSKLFLVYFCIIKVSFSWSLVSQIKSTLFNVCPLDSKNKWKHLDSLLLVYVNCVHNIWRLIVWQWCTKPCKQYLSNNGQFPCEMDWKECDSIQKTILKWWPFNLMNCRNVTCSKAPLKLETSIYTLSW